MSDPTFEALSSVPGHLSSFVASAHDGKVVQSTSNTEYAATAAYQMLTDASLLSKSTAALQQDKIERITVTFPNQYHAFTVSNDLIYGIERTNNASN